MLIILRNVAKAQGLTRYYTGRSCKYGHVAERLVSNFRCAECLSAYTKAWNKAHREVCADQQRKWCEKNREYVRARKKSYYKTKPKERESQAVRSRKWLEANREKSRAASARWRKTHLATAAAAQQRRRTSLLQRMPSWADHEKIRQFYILAKELTEQTGIEHEVDHIVPLQGRLVSGLHIETNLQVLPKKLNRAKGARFQGWEVQGELNGLFS